MRLARIASLSALFLFPLLAGAQMQQRVPLQLTIVMDGENQPTDKEITVTLMDEWSAIEAVQTTKHGMVSFVTKPGIHRVRIIGADIEQFDTEFILDREMPGMMTLVISPKPSARIVAKAPNQPIAAVRLKIPGKARKELERGEKAVNQKRWEEARLHFEKAILFYPEYDLAYYALARLALGMHNKEGARLHLEKALRLNDAFVEANRDLAAILMAESRYAEAEPLLRKSLEGDPTNLWALSAIALSELTSGKLAEAVAHAQKVHSVAHPGYASVHLIAARAFEAAQQPAQALEEYRAYLAEDPGGPNASLAQAGVERMAGATPSPK